MKAVLISIQPKWCELIASGKKTVEVRKTKPKLETPFKVYIYCTKDEPLYKSGEKFWCEKAGEFGNGKVIGEFVCDTIITDKTFGHNALFKAAVCLSEVEAAVYCVNNEMYGWHISDLIIYNEPKKLSEFTKAGALSYDDWLYGIYNGTSESTYEKYLMPFKATRPPRSWCYVERFGEG